MNGQKFVSRNTPKKNEPSTSSVTEDCNSENLEVVLVHRSMSPSESLASANGSPTTKRFAPEATRRDKPSTSTAIDAFNYDNLEHVDGRESPHDFASANESPREDTDAMGKLNMQTILDRLRSTMNDKNPKIQAINNWSINEKLTYLIGNFLVLFENSCFQ